MICTSSFKMQQLLIKVTPIASDRQVRDKCNKKPLKKVKEKKRKFSKSGSETHKIIGYYSEIVGGLDPDTGVSDLQA